MINHPFYENMHIILRQFADPIRPAAPAAPSLLPTLWKPKPRPAQLGDGHIVCIAVQIYQVYMHCTYICYKSYTYIFIICYIV